MLSRLRASIASLERRSLSSGAPGDRPAWTLGAPVADALLGGEGLDASGVHEIKPAEPGGSSTAAGMGAALGFILMLAIRRLQALAPQAGDAPAATSAATSAAVPDRILWCWSSSLVAETGRLYGPGLAGLGLDPGRFIIVEPAREKDVLWAVEEGLGSASLALVVGALSALELTPARRLALAAKAGATPALLLTHCRSPDAAATASRWRVGQAAGGPHPLLARGLGAVRLSLSLERCRHRPQSADAAPFVLEWSDAALRFRMASRSGDRADGADRSRRRAG